MKSPALRMLSFLLCAVCLLPMTACDGGGDVPATVQESAAPTEAPTEAETEAPTETPTLSPEEKLTAEREAYLSTVTYRDFVLTGESEPYFMGRWFVDEIDGVSHTITTTDGSHLYFLIENAPSFDVNFTVITRLETPYFAYSIDGGEPVRQHVTEPTVTLPDSGRHTVRIIADGMTETEQKWRRELGFALKSVTPAEGGSLCGIRPTEPVVYFYGDSITEGIRALNMNATADGNSATNAYSWQCAERLGVTPYLVGYGATGILMSGSFSTMEKAIDYLSHNRTVEEGVCPVTPDLIVVNHGCNDAGQPEKAFADALAVTMDRLREKYPEAPIVYVIPFTQGQATAIRRVMEGRENAYVIETSDWRISYTDNDHPDVEGARYTGDKLATALKELLGEDFFTASAD